MREIRVGPRTRKRNSGGIDSWADQRHKSQKEREKGFSVRTKTHLSNLCNAEGPFVFWLVAGREVKMQCTSSPEIDRVNLYLLRKVERRQLRILPQNPISKKAFTFPVSIFSHFSKFRKMGLWGFNLACAKKALFISR